MIVWPNLEIDGEWLRTGASHMYDSKDLPEHFLANL